MNASIESSRLWRDDHATEIGALREEGQAASGGAQCVGCLLCLDGICPQEGRGLAQEAQTQSVIEPAAERPLVLTEDQEHEPSRALPW